MNNHCVVILLVLCVARSVSGFTDVDLTGLSDELTKSEVDSSIHCLIYCFSDTFSEQYCITVYYAFACTKMCQVYQLTTKPYRSNAVPVTTIQCEKNTWYKTSKNTCDWGDALFGKKSTDPSKSLAFTACYTLPGPDGLEAITTAPVTPADADTPAQLTSDTATATSAVSVATTLTSTLQPSTAIGDSTSGVTTPLLTADSTATSCTPCPSVTTETLTINITVQTTVYATPSPTVAITTSAIATTPSDPDILVDPVAPIDPSSTDAFINSIVEGMIVNKNETSQYKRRYVSAPDERTSSKSMGLVAVVLLACLFILIGLMDIRHLITDLIRMKQNIASALRKKPSTD